MQEDATNRFFEAVRQEAVVDDRDETFGRIVQVLKRVQQNEVDDDVVERQHFDLLQHITSSIHYMYM